MSDPLARRFFEERLPGLLRRQGRAVLPERVELGFIVDGPRGGAWQVASGRGGAVEVGRLVPGAKDLVVRCLDIDFEDILGGRLPPAVAFEDGRVRVEGDIGLLLRLRALLPLAAA
jgi:hypothetical protein